MPRQFDVQERPRRPNPYLPWSIATPFHWIEYGTACINYGFSKYAIFKIVENIGRLAFLFTIVGAALSYVSERSARERERIIREKQARFDAYALCSRAAVKPAGPRSEAFDLLYNSGASLIGTDLSSLDLRSKPFPVNTSFRDCSLDGSALAGAIQGASFDDATLVNADLREMDLSEASFVRAHLGGTVFRNAVLKDADFSYAYLTEDPSDQGKRFGPADLFNADLRYTLFRKATLKGVSFKGADVKGADFSGATLDNADFSGALNLTVEQVKLAGTRSGIKLPDYLKIPESQSTLE